MNVVKCTNNHYFDMDKSQLCPHCGASTCSGDESTAKAEKKPKRSLWGSKAKVEDNRIISVPDKTIGKTFGVFDQKDMAESNDLPVDNRSNVIDNYSDDTDKSGNSENTEKNETAANKFHENINESYSAVKRSEEFEAAAHKEKSALQEAVNTAAAGGDGKTVGYFSIGTVGSTSNEPVVGWLVCVKGYHFGESFNIVAGRNAIGRANINKIVLSNEDSVSREKHAWIIYDPKNRDFYIQPGESSGISYLNESLLMEPQKLNIYDKIELGKSVLLFIPMCGEQFTWDDYLD